MPTDTCPICGGTGWRTLERGKEREAVRCDCRVQGRAERLLEAAHIPARYEHCELATFQYDPDDKRQKSIGEARVFAGRFVEEYPTDKTGLLFVGSVGVGKTHLAVGIIKALIREKGIHCLFCDYRELLKQIQNSYASSVQATEMEVLRPVFDAELLVLDELGAVRSTEWVFDTVNYILNSRYNDNKTTIITTNFPDGPEEISPEIDNLRSPSAAERAARRETLGDRIGERMRSRLHEMCKKVEIEGADYRQQSKQAHFQRISAPSRLSLRNSKAAAHEATVAGQLDRTEIETKQVAAAKELSDKERPCLTLTVQRPRTDEEWHALDKQKPPAMFHLEHCGGRAARFVQVQPLKSSSGTFTMRFDEVPVLTGNRPSQLAKFTIYQNGASDLSRDPHILPIMQSADMLTQFLKDHPPGEKEAIYGININYRDQDNKEYTERLNLRCQYAGLMLSIEPRPQQ